METALVVLEVGVHILTETNFHNFEDGHGPVKAHKHAHGGGWVAETAHVEASAFVGPSARVSGQALVSGEAEVSGQALVNGARDYLCVGPIGPRDAYLTVTFRPDLQVSTGCSTAMSLSDFVAAVEETHGESPHGREYRALIAFIRVLLAERDAGGSDARTD